MVPPSFVQYALRRGAARVVFATCSEGDCEHRLGDRWLRERLAGARQPALRASVPRTQVVIATDEHR
jgi:coenzyme F420-reducing hydrogenase delta subunit